MGLGDDRFNEGVLRSMGVSLASGEDGRGVAIAVIDYGFDLLHPSLLDRGGASRFRSFWDQNLAPPRWGIDVFDVSRAADLSSQALSYLIVRSRETGSREVFDRLYDPHANYYTRDGVEGGAHGTLMASIAAGTSYGGFRGVAPGADLIGVQLGLLDHHWKEEDAAGQPAWITWEPHHGAWDGWRSYCDAPQIVAALDYVYGRAVDLGIKALVINLSLGAAAGAHDAHSAAARKIAELTRRGLAGDGPSCAVVVATGNAGAHDGHFAVELAAGGRARFEWQIPWRAITQKKLEIWYRADSLLDVALSPSGPAGAQIRVPAGQTSLIEANGRRVGIADHRSGDDGRLSRVCVLLHPPSFPGALAFADGEEAIWEITIAAPRASGPAQVHAWIERDDEDRGCSWLSPSQPSSTLSPLAAADGAIVVGAHAGGPGATAFAHASAGPLPWCEGDAALAPHLSASGYGVWGARSKTTEFMRTSGTSAAAALVSGAAALVLQRVVEAGQRMTRDELLAALLGGPARAWDARLGFGPVRLAVPVQEAAA
jgi:subtilisin family serine protease